jgi:hypothetical protein
MIRTVMISTCISAQGKLLRTLPNGMAVIDTGMRQVTGKLLGNAPKLEAVS